jgi:hypothetical protein
MKFTRVLGASLLATWVSGSAGAAGPGVPGILDRPTPPACCADGICYPNPTTWGAYPTRWRRWPGEVLAPTPADAAAPRPGDLPPLEPLGPNDEDRRAPPPTVAPEAENGEVNGEIRRTPATSPATPLTPPVEAPGTSPLAPPGGLDTTPGSPFEDDAPSETETGLPFGQFDPTGAHDPPPAPPFRAPVVAEAPRQRRAEPTKPAPSITASPRNVAPSSPAPARRAVVPSSPDGGDDPPPAFPLTLG